MLTLVSRGNLWFTKWVDKTGLRVLAAIGSHTTCNFCIVANTHIMYKMNPYATFVGSASLSVYQVSYSVYQVC